jgi:hypothetical protein
MDEEFQKRHRNKLFTWERREQDRVDDDYEEKERFDWKNVEIFVYDRRIRKVDPTRYVVDYGKNILDRFMKYLNMGHN